MDAGDGQVDGVAGERRGASAREVLASVWPGVLLVLAGVAGFVLLLDAVREQEDLWRLDEPLLAWMVAHRTPVVTGVLTVVTTASGPFVLPVLVAVGCV